MPTQFDKTVETFYEASVLSKFPLPNGKITWDGDSDLDRERRVYFFHIDKNEYLLVSESFHDSDTGFAQLLIGDAVAPHQHVTRIHPKESEVSFIRIGNEDGKFVPYITGYYSLFRIEG